MKIFAFLCFLAISSVHSEANERDWQSEWELFFGATGDEFNAINLTNSKFYYNSANSYRVDMLDSLLSDSSLGLIVDTLRDAVWLRSSFYPSPHYVPHFYYLFLVCSCFLE